MSKQENPLPRNWKKIRRLVLERDNFECQIKESRCTGKATEVDHRIPRNFKVKTDKYKVSETRIIKGSNQMSNLRSVCSNCHKDRDKPTGLGGKRYY